MTTPPNLNTEATPRKMRAAFARNAMSNIKLPWKMALMLALTILAMTGMGLAGNQGLQTMRFHLSNIYDFMLIPIVTINQADTALADTQYRLEVLKQGTLSRTEQEAQLRETQADAEKAAQVINRYNAEWVTTLSPEFTALLRDSGRLDLQEAEAATLAALHTAFDQYLATRDIYLQSVQSGTPDSQLGAAALQALLQVRVQLQRLIEINDAFAQLSDQAAIAAQSQALTTLGLVSGLILILSLALASLIVFSTTSRLNELTRGALSFQVGQLELGAIDTTGRDEIGVLARAFKLMAAQLRELIGALEQRVEARTAQLRTSAEVSRAAASILDTDQLLLEVVNLITDRFGFYYAAIFLLDEAGEWAVLRAATGAAGQQLLEQNHKLALRGQSMVSTALRLRHSRIVLDVDDEAVRFANPLLPETRSEIALPLVVADRALGVLDVQSTQMAAFDEASAAVLQAMADQIAIALSNTFQFQQTESALQNARRQNEVNLALAQAEDTSGLLYALVAYTAEDVDQAAILFYGPQDVFGRPMYAEASATWAGYNIDNPVLAGTRFTPEQVPFLEVVRPGRPLVISDAAKDEIKPEYRQALSAWRARALVALGLGVGDKSLGALIFTFNQPHLFTQVELDSLQTYARQTAVILYNRQLVEESQVALQQIDEINRRLTGEAWEGYRAATGQPLRQLSWRQGLAGNAQPENTGAGQPSAVTAPVVVNGLEIGALRLEDPEPGRVWPAEDLSLLAAIASEVSIAVEKARLSEETERRAQREQTINRIAGRIRNAASVEQMLSIAAQELRREMQASRTVVEIAPESQPRTDQRPAAQS